MFKNNLKKKYLACNYSTVYRLKDTAQLRQELATNFEGRT
jgi:hypothetical protein